MGKRLPLTSNFPLRKCCKRDSTSEEDLISRLPDEILVCIISYLTLKEAAATSVLSSRWTYLWMFTSRLTFDADKALDKIAKELDSYLLKMERRKYVKWVKGVLQLHKTTMLEEFRICFDLNKSSKNSIDKWLRFALARGVQRLELNLLEYGEKIRYFTKCYTFPSKYLSKITMHPCELMGFTSLKVLCLKCVNVSGEVLEFFLSNCPVLEGLVVHGSGDLVNLEVAGPSIMLKYLEICYCFNFKSIKIIGTNHLVSFKLFGSGIDVLLKNVSMLTEVSIGFGPGETVRHAFSKLSCCLDQLEVLTFSIPSAEKNMELFEFPKLTKLRKLVLVTNTWKDRSLIGFTSLIKASPYLEEFVLELKWFHPSGTGRKNMKAINCCPHENLKVVELAGYYGRTSDLELAMYFLKNVVALEKLIIDPRNRLTRRAPMDSNEIEEEEAARSRAKQQFEGKLPPQVELVIL